MKTNKINLKKEISILKKTIAAKCLDCVCYQPKEIQRCQIINCPLWNYRPAGARGMYSLIKELKKKIIVDPEAEN